MNITITGGTGFIGSQLTKVLQREGHEIVILTREKGGAVSSGLALMHWDGMADDELVSVVNKADAVINLAGENIGARWTEKRKRRIGESRAGITSALVTAMTKADRKPSVFISGSAVGYYGDTGDELVTEKTGKGTGFLSDVVDQWETEARKAESIGIRTVLLRTGVVLGREGGALEKMLLPFRLFVGGPIGKGTQWFPWVHLDDVCGAILFALRSQVLSGPFNVVAPESVTMKEFCSALGRALGRPSWLPAPSFALRIALGEMSEMILTGQKVLPARLVDAGFVFAHPGVDEAVGGVVG